MRDLGGAVRAAPRAPPGRRADRSAGSSAGREMLAAPAKDMRGADGYTETPASPKTLRREAIFRAARRRSAVADGCTVCWQPEMYRRQAQPRSESAGKTRLQPDSRAARSAVPG